MLHFACWVGCALNGGFLLSAFSHLTCMLHIFFAHCLTRIQIAFYFPLCPHNVGHYMYE